MNLKLLLSLLLLPTLIFTNVFAFGEIPIPDCPHTLNRDLKIGMVGYDVKILQEILNSDHRTQIAKRGTGSPGQESYSFGNGTRVAVIKLQKLYNDIVTVQDGNVLGDTRTVLNTICNNQQPKATTATTTKIVTPITISLSSPDSYIHRKIKVILNSSTRIVTPTADSVICDKCTVREIRKLAQKEYLINVIPDDGAKSVEVQIEAEKIFDLDKNTNDDASNNLIFTNTPPTVTPAIDLPSISPTNSTSSQNNNTNIYKPTQTIQNSNTCVDPKTNQVFTDGASNNNFSDFIPPPYPAGLIIPTIFCRNGAWQVCDSAGSHCTAWTH